MWLWLGQVFSALETYRGRWQVELALKHFKSIIRLGHLRRSDPAAAITWIHGKLFEPFGLRGYSHTHDSSVRLTATRSASPDCANPTQCS